MRSSAYGSPPGPVSRGPKSSKSCGKEFRSPFTHPVDTLPATDPGSIPGSGRFPGEGHGNPLSILAWRPPWTAEPGGLQFVGLQRVDTTEQLTLSPIRHFPNPHPLEWCPQPPWVYSCTDTHFEKCCPVEEKGRVHRSLLPAGPSPGRPVRTGVALGPPGELPRKVQPCPVGVRARPSPL